MQDKVALVTGGLRGLGRAMTLGLAASGYRVAAVGHILNDIADIEDMADSLKLRELILPLAADLREPKDCDEVIGKTLARFGSVDILVNNAGLTFTYIAPPRFRRGTPQNFWQVSDEIVENVIVTNFLSADRMARRVAPAMLEAGWGRIINVTTKLDTMNRLGTHPYGASKAALEMATEVWAKDAEGSGLTVNIVNPGAGAGPQHRGWWSVVRASREPSVSDKEALSHIRYQADQMPQQDQARGQRDDHYRDVVALAWAIRAAVKDDRHRQHEEACTERSARFDQTHPVYLVRGYGRFTLCPSARSRAIVEEMVTERQSSFAIFAPSRSKDRLGYSSQRFAGDATVPVRVSCAPKDVSCRSVVSLGTPLDRTEGRPAMLAIWVKVLVKPYERGRFLKAIEADALGSERDEPGCMRFNVLQDAEDQNV